VIQAFGFTATGGRVAVRPTYRNDFGIQSADVLGNAAAQVPGGVVDATSTVSILGYLDLDQDPGAFSFAFDANMRLSIPSFVSLSLQVNLLITNRNLIDSHFLLVGMVRAGPLDFNVTINVGVGGVFGGANLHIGFDITVVSGSIDAGLTISFPTPLQFGASASAELCIVGQCAGVGASLSIGASTSICLDVGFAHITVAVGPQISGGLGACP